MRFHIPFTFSSIDELKVKSRFFLSKIKYKKKTKLEEDLMNSDVDLSREEYLAICLRTLSSTLPILFVVFTTTFLFIRIKFFYLFGFLTALLFSSLLFFSQLVYPRIYISRRQKNIEKNLISALRDIVVQLNSGIPLFNILVNISSASYGELSKEFKKAVKRISSGEPEAAVLDDIGNKNPSVFFRRTLWQISSGMKSGANMSVVIEDSINALNEEQLIQIQSYGNKLNPLVVFYMLIAIIVPALSITFLTIISSMISLPTNMTILLFVGLFVFVFLIQIMFLGLIKSRRPSLL